MNSSKKKRLLDLLINHFWRSGYTLTGRKYSKYLSEPPNIGSYEIDAIGRSKKDYAIGLCLDESDLTNKNILEKIRYLSTRRTRYSKKNVYLFVGIPRQFYKSFKQLISSLEEGNLANLKLIALTDTRELDLFNSFYEEESSNFRYVN